MNTIPLTLDSYKPTYTVIGNTKTIHNANNPAVSVVLLNRGPRPFRVSALTDLLKAGFHSIISLETGVDTPELEAIAGKTPELRYICMHDAVNPGVLVNIGIREALTPYILVLWNDMRLVSSALSSRFIDRIAELDLACLVPLLTDSSAAVIPSISHPAQSGKSFKVVLLEPEKDGEKSLYPFDYCGIYSKDKFRLLGGFDWTINNPYWQKLDFGLRAWLWGERLCHAQALKIKYDDTLVVDDMSIDDDYSKFWLKNLAPVYKGDSASIPWVKLLKYIISSRKRISASVKDFSAAKTWVEACSFRFKADASCLAELWDPLF